ncbi:MAG: 6-pyruvoyl tetrahydrobiopterin synthase [Gammaproteobacteria bacterium]|nr:6-pyruvoyl tetrahydrobiopterin synthase [Gammaproteobacteria bacterium]
MNAYLTTIELQKENMTFNAGHTTIFSATEREPLHGHYYQISVAVSAWVTENGMKFDYRYYKKRVGDLCMQLNQIFLMPMYSPYLEISEDSEYYYFKFNHKTMPFLKEDVKLMPVTNITVEELSSWFVKQLTSDLKELDDLAIEKIEVKVFSAPGQSAGIIWKRETDGRNQGLSSLYS